MDDHKNIIPSLLTEAVNEAITSVYAPVELVPNDEGLYGLEGVFSTIYIKGDLVGKLSLFLRPSYAAKVVANMLGQDEMDEEGAETLDGIGEVVNMTIGCLKHRIAGHKLNVEISIPSTRLTGVIPPSRWDNNIEQVFRSKDVYFKVFLSYRVASKEEKASVAPPVKPKMSAAELIKMALAKKKA